LLAALLLFATAPAMAAPQPSAPQDTDVPPLAHAVELRVLSADGDSEPLAGSPVYLDGAFRGHADAGGKLVLEALAPGPHLVQVDLFALHPGYALASLGEVSTEGGADLTSSDIDRGKLALNVDVSASGSVVCSISMREEAVADSFSQAASVPIPVPGSEDATATKEPWAGWWWPMRTGQTANGYFPHGAPGPLEKYDQYVEATEGGNSQAKEWELANHYKPSAPSWFGHCHAWSAAAILEDEPLASVTKEGIIFYVGDQKGLLTECHYSDPVDMFVGTRFDPTTSPDHPFADVYPNDFTMVLRDWIKDRGEAIVMDREPGAAVWNYPLFKYDMTFSPAGGSKVDVNATVWYVTDGVSHPDDLSGPGYIHTETYEYWITVDGTGEILSGPYTSSWTGSSVNWHPDFLWHPVVALDPNPELDCTKVGEIVGKQLVMGDVVRSNNYYNNHQLKIQVPVQQIDPTQQTVQVEWQVKNPAGQTIDLPTQSYTMTQTQQTFYPTHTIPGTWQQGKYGLKVKVKDGEQTQAETPWIKDAFEVKQGTPTQLEDPENLPSLTYTVQGPVDLTIIDNETGEQVGKLPGQSVEKSGQWEEPVVQQGVSQSTFQQTEIAGPTTYGVQAKPNPTEGTPSVTLSATVAIPGVTIQGGPTQQQQQQTITIKCPKETGYTTQAVGQQTGQYVQTVTSQVGQQVVQQQTTQQTIEQGQKQTSQTQVSTAGGQFTTQQSAINIAPVAIAGPYQVADVGQVVQFDGSASYDPDGTVVSHEWDFGDGNTAAGASPARTYAVEGTYTAVLVVTDDDGATDTDFINIIVVQPGNGALEGISAYPNPFCPVAPYSQTLEISAVGVQGLSPLEVTITRDGWFEPVQILSLTEYPVFVTPPTESFSEYYAEWDGTHMTWGTPVPDGQYEISIWRWDEELASTTVTVFCGEWQLDEVWADPDPFDPDVEDTLVTATGTAGMSPLTLWVLRPGWPEPVNILPMTETEAGRYTATWTGEHMTWLENVPEGEYQLMVVDGTGEPLISGMVTVRYDTGLDSITASPDPFNPVIGQTTEIEASGAAGLGPLELWILDPAWWEPTQILPMVEIDGGTYRTTWDGYHMHGYVAPDGVYDIVVYDSVGELIAGTVTVDTQGAEAAGMRAKLTWNTPDDDLDLHFLKQGAALTSSDDCYYGNKHPDWDGDGEWFDPDDPANNDENDPYLDIDVLSGYGPEHITMYDPPAGTYTIVVDYWSDWGDAGPSDATVTVRLFEGTAYETETTFGPRSLNDTYPGEYWYVTNITFPGGTFTPVTGEALASMSGIPAIEAPPRKHDGIGSTQSASQTTIVEAAEYFVDTVGADGTGEPMVAFDGAFDSGAEDVIGIVDVGGLSLGEHLLYVHGKDSNGQWGPTQQTVVDVTSPLTDIVWLEPQHSNASFCSTKDVEIWVDAVEFKAGQILLDYDPACAEVTDWAANATDFPLNTWDSGTAGEEWINFSATENKTGSYLIGTLSIHCLSEADCTTDLDFVQDGLLPSQMFDEWGSEIPVTWEDGTFECKTGTCGDVAPYPGCNQIVNMGDLALLHSYVGYPGSFSLCCDECGDVAPYPDCNGSRDMGDVVLLLNYIGHPGDYGLCCETGPMAGAAPVVPQAGDNEVRLFPQLSRAPYSSTVQVDMKVTASNLQGGQTTLTYDPTCVDVAGWARNTASFLVGTWDSNTAGEERITFAGLSPVTGTLDIGTLTLLCTSEADCTSSLAFAHEGPLSSMLFDPVGAEIAATWTDGAFESGAGVYLPLVLKAHAP
jgi:hypothetical protein